MDFETERSLMVETQLVPRGISDPKVLSAFREVQRHKFVPEEYLDSAYDDHPLPIGNGQTISQPYMVALMTEKLAIEPGQKILEIGGGSGYQAAIIAQLGANVITIERIKALVELCRTNLKNAGYDSVEIVEGDGTLGYEERAPYDGIIVTCGSPGVPSSYAEQLKEGGRLVIPVGERFSQVLTVFTKKKTGMEAEQVCGCVFVPLVGKDGFKI